MSDLLVSCRDPANRYKNQFSNKNSIIPPAHYRFEGFSHKEAYTPPNSCVDACNAAAVGTPLFESCRTGSIAACQTITSSNLDQCFSDKCKYAELDKTLNAWCTANPTDINYYKYCQDSPLSADKLAILKDLMAIDKDFLYLVVDNALVSGSTVVKTASTLLNLSSSFTTAQLELLFKSCHIPNSPEFKKWQDLYAKAKGISKLDAPPPKSYPGQGDPLLKAISTGVLLRNGSGQLIINGDFAFPYTTTGALSYDAKDKFWTQLIVSAYAVNGNWDGSVIRGVDSGDLDRAKQELANRGMLDILIVKPIAITGLAAPANAYVFYINNDRAKYVAWAKKLVADPKMDLQKLYTTGTCAFMADACFDRDLDILQTQRYNSVSNTICDKASSPTTGETNDAFYSSANAKTLLDACAITYSTTMCNVKDNRYKSAFTSRPSPSTHHAFEGFSHKEDYTTGCADACNTATAGTPLFESCRAGSLAYCGSITDSNIDQCFADKCKYSELDKVLNSWCDTNKTHPKYSNYCMDSNTTLTDKNDTTTAAPGIDSIVQPSQSVATTTAVATPVSTPTPTQSTPTPTPIQSTPIQSTPTTTPTTTTPIKSIPTPAVHTSTAKDSETMWIIIGVVMAFVLIIISVVIYKKRSSISAFRHNFRMPRYGRGDV